MARVGTILQCQWHAYWRRFARKGNLAAGNQGILLIISVLILIKYSRALSVATSELSTGTTLMLERLLAGVFVLWLFPLMSSARLSIAKIIGHISFFRTIAAEANAHFGRIKMTNEKYEKCQMIMTNDFSFATLHVRSWLRLPSLLRNLIAAFFTGFSGSAMK